MLELRGVSRRMGQREGDALACDGIDLAISTGEIHGLLGENGAGKSTLVRILAGLATPDAGMMLLNGAPLTLASPRAARARGIGVVFQQTTLFAGMTLAEGLAVALGSGTQPTAEARLLATTSARFGVRLDPDRLVRSMSAGQRRLAELLRCVMQAPGHMLRLLVLDEPDAMLAPPEAEALTDLVRAIAATGCAVLCCARRSEDVMALCVRVTVLRAGRVATICDPREARAERLAELMTGRAAPATRRARHRPGAAVLQLRGLSLPCDQGMALHRIDLDLRAGEILGIAGAAGHGQAELVAAISGVALARRPDDILLEGVPSGRLGVAQRRRAGLRHMPADRLDCGVVGEMTLSENAFLTCWDMGLIRRFTIRRDKLERLTRSIMDLVGLPPNRAAASVAHLSGAELQRFILGRELGFAPRVVVAERPTWGLGIGAARDIHQALLDLAAAGVAVLLVSDDLDEVLALSDRVAVMTEGQLSQSVAVTETSAAQLGVRLADAA